MSNSTHARRRSISLVMAAAGIAAAALSPRPAAAETFNTGQLLLNPGAEAGSMEHWTGNSEVRDGTEPGAPTHIGNYQFWGGTNAQASAYQDVNLLGVGSIVTTANMIDNGEAT